MNNAIDWSAQALPACLAALNSALAHRSEKALFTDTTKRAYLRAEEIDSKEAAVWRKGLTDEERREFMAEVDRIQKKDKAQRAKGSTASNGATQSERPGADRAAGVGVLDKVESFLRRFVSYPTDHACIAHVLWIAHTHMMDLWDSTPRIAFLSPEPGSGKSRALEASEPLVPNPIEAINVTPAYLFRKVGSEQGRPTVLYDEIDTVFGPKAKENEEIRGLLNAGHRKHGMAGRCVMRGKEVHTEEIPAYCAVALAGLGGLPDTILSRSLVVRMRRRAPGERVEPFRRRLEAERGNQLRDQLAAWCRKVQKSVTRIDPAMPMGIEDRDADVWEDLLVIADAARGEWPERARKAAMALVAEARATTPSLGIRLLADLRVVFGDRRAMSTEVIIKSLCAIEEAPWSDLRGKALNDIGLANRLRPYGIKSDRVDLDNGQRLRGYLKAWLADAWQRYLPVARDPIQPVQSGQPEAGASTNGMARTAWTDLPEANLAACLRCSGEGCRWCAND